jgi:spermidine/putrescine-binding protein
VAILAFFMAACGGGAQEVELAEELHIYNWSEYIDPEIFADFEAEYGVKVIEDTFASNEELLAKLQAGATGYDLIIPSDYMVEIMIEEGLLAELDKENIPNFSNLDEKFTDPPFDPGMVFCIPYQWGTTGIGYNSEEFDDPPDSWAYLFDPDIASQYAGKFSMLNDSRESIGAALKYLGYSLNSTDESQLMEARDLLIQQKQWVYSYDSDQFEDLVSADETLLGHGWSGDFFTAAVEDERVWYAIPTEGAVIWVDNMCIPASAPNKYTAEVFINYLLEPEVGAAITNYTWFGSPNAASEEFIDEEILSEPAIYPPPEVMDRLEWIEDVGDATPMYERIWTEVKASE